MVWFHLKFLRVVEAGGCNNFHKVGCHPLSGNAPAVCIVAWRLLEAPFSAEPRIITVCPQPPILSDAKLAWLLLALLSSVRFKQFSRI